MFSAPADVVAVAIPLGRSEETKLKGTHSLLFSLILLVFVPGVARAQAWSGILDPTRAIDWSTAGVPGGIPTNLTQCGATVNSPGTGDATTVIQNALNACTANHFVLLAPGTFVINSNLVIPTKVVLRGSGPDKTKLDLHGTSQAAIYFGTANDDSQRPVAAGTSTNITGGTAKGSTSVTVASSSGISTGTLLALSQANLSYMTEQGNGGACSWCNGGLVGDSGQVVRVTNVAGNTLTISPGLYIDYTNSPVAYPFTRAATVNAGLESVKLYANNSGYKELTLMMGCYGCWVKNVEDDFADNAHMFMYYDLNDEVRDCYFHDGYNHGPGGTDNQLTLGYSSSNNLVINSIFYRQHVGIMLEWGSSGNVVAYNYLDGNYHQAQLNWMLNDIDFHGAHPMMNLFEGNVEENLTLDDYWGSSSHSTIFRNYSQGSRKQIPPVNARGPLQPGSFQWESSNEFAYDVNELAQYTNLVGVIAGSAQTTAIGAAGVRISPAAGFSNQVCVRIGYDGSNDATGHGTNLAFNTAFIHGLYDCAAGTFTWDSGHPSHTLPASFFLSAKPSWWGAVPWPPIGPDVAGGTGIGGFAYPIPAQTCWSLATANGTTNTGTFNAATCYGNGVTGTLPNPPTALAAQVQ